MTLALAAAVAAINEAAERNADEDIRRGARFYSRPRHLPELMRDIDPADLFDDSPAVTLRIVERLRNAITAAQNGLRAGHWAASESRCLALRQALAAEEAKLEKTLTWRRS